MLDQAYTIFVTPLLQIYAALFSAPSAVLGTGACIIAFGATVNLLLVPIYNQMERHSSEGRAVRQRVASEVDRMKRHFRGRERYFYVRAVHRQFRYHPIRQVLGSSDLFVQVLIFATVYGFLSKHPDLVGKSFGPLTDLSKPDGLLAGINLLPFVMTAINAAAVFAYVQERSKRMQALALATVFLVLLYPSASGLVLYWTTNNAFSLLRSLLRKWLAGRPANPLAHQWAELRSQQ